MPSPEMIQPEVESPPVVFDQIVICTKTGPKSAAFDRRAPPGGRALPGRNARTVPSASVPSGPKLRSATPEAVKGAKGLSVAGVRHARQGRRLGRLLGVFTGVTTASAVEAAAATARKVGHDVLLPHPSSEGVNPTVAGGTRMVVFRAARRPLEGRAHEVGLDVGGQPGLGSQFRPSLTVRVARRPLRHRGLDSQRGSCSWGLRGWVRVEGVYGIEGRRLHRRRGSEPHGLPRGRRCGDQAARSLPRMARLSWSATPIGGAVVTEAGNDPNVAGLVYIAAFAPTPGESVNSLIADPPPGVAGAAASRHNTVFLFLDKEKFAASFAADVRAGARSLHGGLAGSVGESAPAGEISEPAVDVPAESRDLVATADRMIPPDAQRFMSKRAGSAVVEVEGSHAVYVSKPEPVAELVQTAPSTSSAPGVLDAQCFGRQ